MSRSFFRPRVLLRAAALGLAVVYLWQGLSVAWSGIEVKLPEVRPASVLEIVVPHEEKPLGYYCDEFADDVERTSCLDRIVFQDRDMSLYSNDGRHGCGVGSEMHLDECKRSLEKARRFVWEHWKGRKRGYVSVVRAFRETESITHLFIEPNSYGKWRVVERRLPMLREPEWPEHYQLGDLIEIKWERATADDERYGLVSGTLYLRLSNITGDSLLL
jgi:hypothetical protein